jgi:transposase
VARRWQLWLSARRVTTKVTTVLGDRKWSDKVKPTLRVAPITQLILDEKNANKGTKRGRELLEASLEKYGAGRSVVVDRNNRVIAGNKTVEAARIGGIESIAVIETDGSSLVAVQRADMDLKRDKKARELAIADNRVGELDLEWNLEVLASLGVDLDQFWNRNELNALLIDEAGELILESKLPTTPKGIEEVFGRIPRSRVAFETGTHSPWVSRQMSQLGHEVIVAHACNVQLITESGRKDDRLDAKRLARLAQIDPALLGPVRHRSAKAQIHLTVIRARATLVSAPTAQVNAARGLTKSYGARPPKCGSEQMNREIANGLSQELREALDPLLAEIESLNERIAEYDRRIEKVAKEAYPEVALLRQVKGVGTLIALTYIQTVDDPYRFRPSRDAGCFVGLRPARRNPSKSW